MKLVVLTDEPERHSRAYCERMFAPWSRWLSLRALEAIPTTDPENRLAALGVRPGKVVAVAAKDYSLAQTVASAAGKLGAKCVLPDLPPVGTLENDFLREVSHFDFELGGKNEWDGAPTKHSRHILQHQSSIHCREYYPTQAFDPITAAARRLPLKTLDIGCGPISILRWGALEGKLSITGVDPLLEMYAVVLARHGLDVLPHIRCAKELAAFAEDLDPLIPDGEFDVIYTRNALDHTQQPLKVVEVIGRKLAANGTAMIEVACKEGTRQQWDQLHKTDIFLERGQLMFSRQNERPQPLLTAASGLQIKEIIKSSDEWIACTLRKSSKGSCSRRIISARIPRVTSTNSLDSSPSAADRAVLANRLNEVCTARRLEAAMATDEGTERPSVDAPLRFFGKMDEIHVAECQILKRHSG